MKVLFLIPKNPPPSIDASFTRTFREFVSLCLQRDPRQRPTARDLLKHKFVRMAKKTSYLTELIERHERWKAEGGERAEEDEILREDDDQAGGEMDDMWDFGTVRHVSKQSTVGRANTHHNSVHTNNSYSNVTSHRPPPSPPISRQSVQINTNVPPQALRRTGSEISLPSPVQQKSERLPPLPLSTPGTPASSGGASAAPPAAYDNQATVRHGLPSDSQPKPPKSPQKAKSLSRDLSEDLDEDEEDYGEVLEGSQPYPPMDLQHDHMAMMPDTAMLDTVVLPAIASLFPRVSTQEARIALSTLQRAFTEAERIIPGVTNELVNEIVDSVEHVEDVA